MFGYFCRRAVVSYMKLSFSGVSKLRLDYREWLNGSTAAGYEQFRRDLITFGTACSRTLSLSTDLAMSLDTLLLKTHADEYRWAEPDAYSESVISLYSCVVADPYQFRTWARDWRLKCSLRELAKIF